MPKPLTAEDVLRLVRSLSPQERDGLLRLIDEELIAEPAYLDQPPGSDEFSSEEDGLRWDAEGWQSTDK